MNIFVPTLLVLAFARQPTVHAVTFTWMLNRGYLQMHEVSRERTAVGNQRAKGLGLANCSFQEGDASDMKGVQDRSFENSVIERFVAAGVRAEQVSFARATFTFNCPGTPEDFVGRFKSYYGPTMNAFDAAGKDGRVADPQRQLEDLFRAQNKSARKDMTSIPATFLRVTVSL